MLFNNIINKKILIFLILTLCTINIQASNTNGMKIDELKDLYENSLIKAKNLVKPVEEAEKYYLDSKETLKKFVEQRSRAIAERSHRIQNDFGLELGICLNRLITGIYDFHGFIQDIRYPVNKALYLSRINPIAGSQTYNTEKERLTNILSASCRIYSSHFGNSDKAKLRTSYFSLASDIDEFYLSSKTVNLFNPSCLKEIDVESLKIVRISNTIDSIIENNASTNEDKEFSNKAKNIFKLHY